VFWIAYLLNFLIGLTPNKPYKALKENPFYRVLFCVGQLIYVAQWLHDCEINLNAVNRLDYWKMRLDNRFCNAFVVSFHRPADAMTRFQHQSIQHRLLVLLRPPTMLSVIKCATWRSVSQSENSNSVGCSFIQARRCVCNEMLQAVPRRRVIVLQLLPCRPTCKLAAVCGLLFQTFFAITSLELSCEIVRPQQVVLEAGVIRLAAWCYKHFCSKLTVW